MKTPRFFLTAMLLLASLCPIQAQLTEHFSDGDFSGQPTWVAGNTGDWQINNSFQLQSNRRVANSSFWISTENKLATSAQWDFWVRLQFNPSGANYADVYLTASASDLTLNTTTGYIVRIGNTDDEIALYRKQSNGTMVKIIDGVNGILNTSQNTLRIRVTRNTAHEWKLMRALGGNEQELIVEGKTIDSTYRQSEAFGILVRQSTASFFQRHFFDDFSIKPYEEDLIPPGIETTTAIAPTQLEILFNEPVSAVSASQTDHYIVNNGVGNPAAAQRNTTNPALVTLTFHQPFRNGFAHELIVDGVEDLFGNKLKNEKTTFSFYTPKRNDAIITEIMCDPSPEVGLPNATWIELLNTSKHSFNLQGWRIGREGTSMSGPLPAFILQPDSMVVLCSAGNAAEMQQFGTTLSVPSFPSFPVSGATIWIQHANGEAMHAAKYQPDWHDNPIKANGGWSLEMIDSNHPCGGKENWHSSVDRKGGTPGKKNSIHGSNTDMTAPKILYAFAIDTTHI
ncbi:MAG: lamin tail domain-containing protein, partial [Chitinophagaceae bacterium]